MITGGGFNYVAEYNLKISSPYANHRPSSIKLKSLSNTTPIAKMLTDFHVLELQAVLSCVFIRCFHRRMVFRCSKRFSTVVDVSESEAQQKKQSCLCTLLFHLHIALFLSFPALPGRFSVPQ